MNGVRMKSISCRKQTVQRLKDRQLHHTILREHKRRKAKLSRCHCEKMIVHCVFFPPRMTRPGDPPRVAMRYLLLLTRSRVLRKKSPALLSTAGSPRHSPWALSCFAFILATSSAPRSSLRRCAPPPRWGGDDLASDRRQLLALRRLLSSSLSSCVHAHARAISPWLTASLGAHVLVPLHKPRLLTLREQSWHFWPRERKRRRTREFGLKRN